MRSLRYCPLRHPQQKPGASYPLKFPLIRHRCIFWHLPGINPAVRYDEQLIPVTGAGQAPVCPVCACISDLHMCSFSVCRLYIILLCYYKHYIICVFASAKVRKTSGFPDPRARSHGTYPSDTCKHARPSLFHAHFCLREHYIIFFSYPLFTFLLSFRNYPIYIFTQRC